MKRIAFFLVAVATLAGVVVFMVPAARHAAQEAAPIFGIKIPPGYRDWRLISVAREEGNLNDIRAILGNDVAINAYREGNLPFPDATIIAALHYRHAPSEENNKVFGRSQSFAAGPPTKKFINFVKYRDLDRIASARPAHFAYADRLRAQGKLAIGGPLMDAQGWRIGLLFVYEAASRDEALIFAEQDPFTLANALSGYEISEWRLRGVNLDFLIKANRSADQTVGKNAQIRLFANYAKYGADKSKLAAVRPAHWEYDRTLKSAGKLALAGPFADDKGELLVYNAASREEAMSYLRQDPFSLEGVFADCELLEWLIEGLNPDLLTIDLSSEKG